MFLDNSSNIMSLISSRANFHFWSLNLEKIVVVAFENASRGSFRLMGTISILHLALKKLFI